MDAPHRAPAPDRRRYVRPESAIKAFNTLCARDAPPTGKKLDAIAAEPNRLPLIVRRRHDDKDAIDARIDQHGGNRMLEHRALSQAQILLRNVVAQTGADACSRNQRYISKSFGHERLARKQLMDRFV